MLDEDPIHLTDAEAAAGVSAGSSRGAVDAIDELLDKPAVRGLLPAAGARPCTATARRSIPRHRPEGAQSDGVACPARDDHPRAATVSATRTRTSRARRRSGQGRRTWRCCAYGRLKKGTYALEIVGDCRCWRMVRQVRLLTPRPSRTGPNPCPTHAATTSAAHERRTSVFSALTNAAPTYRNSGLRHRGGEAATNRPPTTGTASRSDGTGGGLEHADDPAARRRSRSADGSPETPQSAPR